MPDFTPEMLTMKVPVKINGTVVEKPLQEVIDEHQLKAASHAKMREAAELKTSAERAIEFESLFKQGTAGDPAAFRQALLMAGFDNEQVSAFLQGKASPDDGASDYVEPTEGDNAEVTELRSHVETLTKAVKTLVDRDRSREVTTTADARVAEIYTALDKHPKLGTIIRGLSEEGRADLQELARSRVGRRAKSPEYAGRAWGPRVIQAGLDDLVESVTRLGITPTADSQETSTTEDDDVLALDESAASILGIPNSGKPHQPTTPNQLDKLADKRVPLDHEDRDSYALARMAKIGREVSKRS